MIRSSVCARYAFEMPSPAWLPLVRGELVDARAALLDLVERLDVADLETSAAGFLSPIAWDLAHVALYEELWLHQRVAGAAPVHRELWPLYDPQEQPREGRDALPLLDGRAALDLLAAVRERTLALVDRLEDGRTNPLLAGGFVFRMVARHEDQHRETILQSLALRGENRPLAGFSPDAPDAGPSRTASAGGFVTVEAGLFELGDDGTGFSWDNERPRHVVDIPAFMIERTPASAGRYAEFVEDGGYARRELWSREGWAWRARENVALPLGWRRTAQGFAVTRFGHTAPLDEARPVERISCHEAEAFARWCGGRLPSEAEWEKAARLGVLEQAGVYEWTASPFAGYPGFEAFPYREYSEVHFGRGYRVLRGASWCIGPRVAGTSYRNWDWPHRRQLFAGVRVARDAA